MTDIAKGQKHLKRLRLDAELAEIHPVLLLHGPCVR